MADSVGKPSTLPHTSIHSPPRRETTASLNVLHANHNPDRVFGHALNTVNKIRPGSTKPPAADRLMLYGLYKQAMEGDVIAIADRPTTKSASGGAEALKREQDKYDAWKSNEGITRTEAKRKYIEKLIETMHEYASGTDEARELVEELEFVWDQIKSNSQHSSNSETSSPLQTLDRSGYLSQGSGNRDLEAAAGMTRSMAAAMDGGKGRMTVLSPMSQADEEEAREAEEYGEEFVDAPVSQVENGDLGDREDPDLSRATDRSFSVVTRSSPNDVRWRKRIESSLIKLTTEVTALREQLEARRFFSQQRRNSIIGWVLRLGWWAVQLFVADAVILWVIILYMRRKKDPRLEGAVRVLLGDAVAQVQKVGRDVSKTKMPSLHVPLIKKKAS
nr:autophagy-related protein 37 [Quercus suber]